MSLEKCYELIGGDLDEIINALGSESIVQKFLLKLLDEDTHLLLTSSIEKKDYAEAFRAAHTIKGISLNLSLKRLYSVANPLTEALRHKESLDEVKVLKLYHSFKEVYDSIIKTIGEFKSSL